MVKPTASIIVLSRNGLDYTKQCVESIYQHTDVPFECIFVDNGSTDGTVNFLNTLDHATVIANEENKGFAGGNNQGMKQACGDYIVLLNNDTIVTPHWLSRLIAWLENDKSIGIVGPRSNNVYSAQRVPTVPYSSQDDMHAFAAQWHEERKGKGFIPHKLIGHCMVFSAALMEAVGGLDERFFPGNYEDDDLCLRVNIYGKKLWVADDVFIHHYGHGTFKSNQIQYNTSSLKNAERFVEKWSIGISGFELERFGYDPSTIVKRESIFIPDRHRIPV
ncbi:glycosyltransferase family 2 protein [Longirhabdus pacifica]|uniref:glycosyltransferase family 2 protein n=1 Tax=Longirhabdus pacifica TaxID=2305227 RepID=UPI001F0C5C99|nr:glycosyltransferase family 2 protein [Longirhabdus pacifica]